MNQTIQNKIDRIKVLSEEKNVSAHFVAETSVKIINDNLSKSIRSEKDAQIFRKELEAAYELAKQK